MTDVRITSTTPVSTDFGNSKNSPLCIDESTDIGYYLDGSTVTPLQCIGGKRYITTTATIDFANIAANGMATASVTLTGVGENDDIILGPPSTLEAGVTWCGYVTAANTVEVRLHNNSGGSLDPASATWRVSAFV